MHVYLSPHLDDATLSCGGTIFRQTQAGDDVLVVNVFAGIPDYEQLTAFARKKHAVWGNPEDVVATRRAEDEAALAILGADAVYWEYGDAIYRVAGERALYASSAGIFGDVDPAERNLPAELAGRVEAVAGKNNETVFYAPLGIGHHVDHLIARDVGLTLVEWGRRVRFYEDFPYVWRNIRQDAVSPHASPLPADLKDRGEWVSEIQVIDVEPKIAAVACYESQIDDIFEGEAAMVEAIRGYAQLVGGDSDAERFWFTARA